MMPRERPGAPLRRLATATRGVAMLEFALTLPIVLTMTLVGAELTNYITTKMRISQVALQLADNAARIGNGSQLEAKKISEADINDLLIGAGLEAGELDLYGRGRVIVSSLEPDPKRAGRNMIRWQRCQGDKTGHKSLYGDAGNADLAGMGPTPQVIAPPNGVTMFAEVYYEYQPLVSSRLVPSLTMDETASMMVRDRRDTSDGAGHPDGVYTVEGVTPSAC